MDSPDYIQQVLDHFCSVTQRLQVSPADYLQAATWEEARIPVAIVTRAIDTKVQRNQGKRWLRTMKLEWLDPEVQDDYHTWKRAVGPWSTQH